jgi:hypothetical protein
MSGFLRRKRGALEFTKKRKSEFWSSAGRKRICYTATYNDEKRFLMDGINIVRNKVDFDIHCNHSSKVFEIQIEFTLEEMLQDTKPDKFV